LHKYINDEESTSVFPRAYTKKQAGIPILIPGFLPSAIGFPPVNIEKLMDVKANCGLTDWHRLFGTKSVGSRTKDQPAVVSNKPPAFHQSPFRPLACFLDTK
jgi:hypothetical protein